MASVMCAGTGKEPVSLLAPNAGRDTGICPVCFRRTTLRDDGTVASHRERKA